ncbi:MAG: hypothetical protein HUK18_04065 [Bacteroidales bacterium]|nr:hypothetical protein [Bacteroidales bacterium]
MANKAIKQEIDRLFTEVRQYHDSKNFRELMEFCTRFKHLSPYNAWLVNLQMPSARYVLTEKQWLKKYRRKIKLHSRPLIILIPFGPIFPIFDISETEAIDENSTSKQAILDYLANPYRVRGNIPLEKYHNLVNNLAYSGIVVEKCLEAAGIFGGELRSKPGKKVVIKRKEKRFETEADYAISINVNADIGQSFATILHELGHLFCHHQPHPQKAWESRRPYLSHAEREFEAETVSWLICERLGIHNPSEKYLSGYIERNDIPQGISINHILLAVAEIEKIMNQSESKALKQGLLWKHRKGFKDIMSEI